MSFGISLPKMRKVEVSFSVFRIKQQSYDCDPDSSQGSAAISTCHIGKLILKWRKNCKYGPLSNYSKWCIGDWDERSVGMRRGDQTEQ